MTDSRPGAGSIQHESRTLLSYQKSERLPKTARRHPAGKALERGFELKQEEQKKAACERIYRKPRPKP